MPGFRSHRPALCRPLGPSRPGLFRGFTDLDQKPHLDAEPAAAPNKGGRPAPKVHIGFRLAADVVETLKASGAGYNARVEQALRKAGFGDPKKATAKRPAKKATAKRAPPAKRRA